MGAEWKGAFMDEGTWCNSFHSKYVGVSRKECCYGCFTYLFALSGSLFLQIDT